MLAVLAAAAEYELELRAERRPKASPPPGAARPDAARKKHIGRPKVTGPAELATLRRLLGDSASVTQAAGTLKISRSAAYAALASTH